MPLLICLSQLHCQPEKNQHVSIGAHKPSQLIVQNTCSNPVLSWADLTRFFSRRALHLASEAPVMLWDVRISNNDGFCVKNKQGWASCWMLWCGVEVKDEWMNITWRPWKTLSVHQPTPWELRISPTQWSCLLVAEVPECFYVFCFDAVARLLPKVLTHYCTPEK